MKIRKIVMPQFGRGWARGKRRGQGRDQGQYSNLNRKTSSYNTMATKFEGRSTEKEFVGITLTANITVKQAK